VVSNVVLRVIHVLRRRMMPPARDLSTDGVASRVVPYRVVVQAIVMPLTVTVITVKSASTST
jgi:hypothetical protein